MTERDATVDGFILEPAVIDPVPVEAGEVAAVLMTNTYTPAPGNIAVTKQVVGDIPADKTFSFDYVCDDPAGTSGSILDVAAGDTKVSRDIPAGATCTVAERDASVDGFALQTSAIGPVVVEAGGVAVVEVTNTYTPAPGPAPSESPSPSATPSESPSPSGAPSDGPDSPGGPGAAEDPALARTGADGLVAFLAALGLLVAGGGLIAARRARG